MFNVNCPVRPPGQIRAEEEVVGKKLKLAYPVSLLLMALVFIVAGFSLSTPSVQEAIVLQKNTGQTTVVLNNQSELVPLTLLKGRRIASVNTGSLFASTFDSLLSNYAEISSLSFYPDSQELFEKGLEKYNTIIVQVTPQSLNDYRVIDFLFKAKTGKELIIAGFGNTAYLKKLDMINSPVVWTTANTAVSAAYSAQVIFGGIASHSRLRDSISPAYHAGAGFSTEKIRLKYSMPEEMGINSYRLNKIDDIMAEAIAEHATPGGVVMVVKGGHVIFEKAYGTHTYEDKLPTRADDIFDLASVTKIAATTVAAMSLYEQKKLDLNAPLSTYLPGVRGTNKSDVRVREAMLHQAGFVNLNFFGRVKAQDHSTDSSYLYSTKVADNYYLRRNFYEDVMWPSMLRSPLPTRGKYVYSDISMYVMKEVIEHQSGTALDEYVDEEIYQPLGMRKAGFKPLKEFNRNEIVPTERDTYFRKSLLQGYVHDPGAALADGVSGHAGLFSSANDLAILSQMLLNGGSYGGRQYFKPETVGLFTSRQSDVSRRGLGFDRWDPESTRGYPSALASPKTFGHTGYTGTSVWIDPEYDLIYIFLSNRVYPSGSTRLNTMRIRPRIQDVIYEAILEGVGTGISASETTR